MCDLGGPTWLSTSSSPFLALTLSCDFHSGNPAGILDTTTFALVETTFASTCVSMSDIQKIVDVLAVVFGLTSSPSQQNQPDQPALRSVSISHPKHSWTQHRQPPLPH